MIVRRLAVLAAVLAPGAAGAQAWTMPAGKGRVIASLLYSHSDRGFDTEGRTRDIPDYDRAELYLAAEYGVTDDVTLLATPSLRHVAIDGERSRTGLGFVDVGARWRVAGGRRTVLSLQATGRIPGSARRDLPAQIGSTDPELDLRVQGGLSFGKGHFAILESAYRLRANDPPDEVRIDATVGLRAAPRLLFVVNSFNTIATTSGRGVFGRHRYHNVFASAAYEVTPRVTLQAGVQGTVAGREALRDRGLFAGAWFRF